MSYDDFWFIDTRVHTRNIRRWLIWFILLFAFVTIGSILAVKSMYNDITAYEIRSTNLDVTVSKAKATNVNGYIKGEVKNEGDEDISKEYLCFLLCDKNNKIKGIEYIEIKDLTPGEINTYELKFKRDNIVGFYLITLDEKLNYENL